MTFLEAINKAVDKLVNGERHVEVELNLDNNTGSVKESKKMTHSEIQNDLIEKYRIDICDGTKCGRHDWRRTHAHPKQRRVCKWKRVNSIQSTFTLLHEIGHIVADNSKNRRCESEYAATAWALQEVKKYGLTVPNELIKVYQDYINRELDRGERRGGKGYARNLILEVL